MSQKVIQLSIITFLIWCLTIGLYFMYHSDMVTLFLKHKAHPGCSKFIPSSDVLSFQNGNVSATNEESLILFIKQQILGPSQNVASPPGKEYHYSQYGQSQLVDEILHERRGGFFVECGAHNGVKLSNSLFFQQFRNWTGILIEANPNSFRRLLKQNLGSYLLNACMSPTKEPREINFSPAGLYGGITNFIGIHKDIVDKAMANLQEIKVQCFSLYHIMQALERHHIDYFSLDVEGVELKILKTIPWDKLKIDVLTIEYNGNRTIFNEYRTLMEETGLYTYAGVLPKYNTQDINQLITMSVDAVFVRKDLKTI